MEGSRSVVQKRSVMTVQQRSWACSTAALGWAQPADASNAASDCTRRALACTKFFGVSWTSVSQKSKVTAASGSVGIEPGHGRGKLTEGGNDRIRRQLRGRAAGRARHVDRAHA